MKNKIYLLLLLLFCYRIRILHLLHGADDKSWWHFYDRYFPQDHGILYLSSEPTGLHCS